MSERPSRAPSPAESVSKLRGDSGIRNIENVVRPSQMPSAGEEDVFDLSDFEVSEPVTQATPAPEVSGTININKLKKDGPDSEQAKLARAFDADIEAAVGRLGPQPGSEEVTRVLSRAEVAAAVGDAERRAAETEVTRVLSRAEVAAAVGDAERRAAKDAEDRGEITRVLSRAELAAAMGDSERAAMRDELARAERVGEEDLIPIEPPETSANPVGIFDREEVLAAARNAALKPKVEQKRRAEREDREVTQVIRRNLKDLSGNNASRVPERPITVPASKIGEYRPQPQKPKTPVVPELPKAIHRSPSLPRTLAVSAPPFTNRPAIGAPPVPKKEVTVGQRISAWWDKYNPFKKAA